MCMQRSVTVGLGELPKVKLVRCQCSSCTTEPNTPPSFLTSSCLWLDASKSHCCLFQSHFYSFHVEFQWKTSSWSFPPCTSESDPWRRKFKATRSWCCSWSPFCRWSHSTYVTHYTCRHTCRDLYPGHCTALKLLTPQLQIMTSINSYYVFKNALFCFSERSTDPSGLKETQAGPT